MPFGLGLELVLLFVLVLEFLVGLLEFLDFLDFLLDDELEAAGSTGVFPAFEGLESGLDLGVEVSNVVEFELEFESELFERSFEDDVFDVFLQFDNFDDFSSNFELFDDFDDFESPEAVILLVFVELEDLTVLPELLLCDFSACLASWELVWLRVLILVLPTLLASTNFLLEDPKNLTPFDTFAFLDIKSLEVKFLGALVPPLRPIFSRISTRPSELVLGSLLFLPTYGSGTAGG